MLPRIWHSTANTHYERLKFRVLRTYKFERYAWRCLAYLDGGRDRELGAFRLELRLAVFRVYRRIIAYIL